MIQVNVSLDPALRGESARSLDESLRQMVVGQDHAIDHIVSAFQMHISGLGSRGRPVCNFLFLGPTGSGKTRMVEAAAEAILGVRRPIVKIDCGEFQHSHEIAKLIGSPPGYLGHRETTPALAQEVLNGQFTEQRKLSFVLFDEVEKASDALWNLLLGILDKATLTLGDNRKVDFSRAMIFLTSNLGASEMSDILAPRLGFSAVNHQAASLDLKEEKTAGRLHRSGVEAARKRFTPEFMNRLDEIVTFSPLGPEQLRKILDIELGCVQQQIFTNFGDRAFVFTLSDQAKSFVLGQGTDVRYGARHLKRTISRMLVRPISNLVSSKQVLPGDWIFVELDQAACCLTFTKRGKGVPETEEVGFQESYNVTTSTFETRRKRKAVP